jgi:hypothetical protein
MAETESLIYKIGADISGFTKSIGDVEKQIKTLRTSLKTASGNEIPEINLKISQLTESLRNLKSVGTPAANSFDDLNKGAKGARIALTDVSRIAQDLPFGFIGIQNNIPQLVQSFSNLKTESGGLSGALKAMGQSLVGPAGIFLAFSVVTSAITLAIQKYGSLGGAVDALFGKFNLSKKVLEDYNKALAQSIGSTATESAEITILTKTLTDLSKPLKDRQAAYIELKKISPDVVAGIDLENISTKEAIKLIDENAKSIQKLLLLKAQEAAISNILTKNSEELATLQIEENKLKKDQTNAQNDLNKSKQSGLLIIGAGRTAEQQAITSLSNATKSLAANKIEQGKLNKVAQEYVALLDPTIKGIAEIDLKTNQLTEALEKQNKAKKDAIKNAKDEDKWKKNEIFNLELAARLTERIYKPVEAIKLTRDNVDFGKLATKPKPTEFFDIKSYQESYDRFIKKIYDSTDQILLDITIKTKLQDISPGELSKATQKWLASGLSLDDFNKQVEEKLTNTRNFISSLLSDPLEKLFSDILMKGEDSFKNFGKIVLEVLKKLIVKLAAAAALAAVLAAISGGGTAVGGAAAPSFGEKFTKIIGGLLGFKREANPNFSGVQGGGMGMSGQVNLVLRGTDLVGSINRTNSQISRVG